MGVDCGHEEESRLNRRTVEAHPPTLAKKRGRPRADDRQVLNGILLRTGIPWNDLPERYGDDSTCHRRLAAWEADGTWERIWKAFLSTLDEQGGLEWTQAFLDGSFVPAKKGEMPWAGGARAKAVSAT